MRQAFPRCSRRKRREKRRERSAVPVLTVRTRQTRQRVVVVVAFSPSTQGEDRPCFVKRFLPAELFSRYQSAADHWEISERKQRLHTQSSLGHLGAPLDSINPFIAISMLSQVAFVGWQMCTRAGWLPAKSLHISLPVYIEGT